MCLKVDHIHKTHHRKLTVAEDISFVVEKGELGALLGPSGCGKTTLLRMIAGFDTPDRGTIAINGKTVFDRRTNVCPEKRGTGMVFQDYALFPHLTVMENIAFGPAPKNRKDLHQLIGITGLSGSENRYPHELSGGQQQRVALARALAPRPALLLMDEPFSNLDISLRESLSEEVRCILNEFSTTGLLVTHNQHEAFAMADKIGVMKHGKLCQWDCAEHLYYHPATEDVAGFIGEGSFIRAQVCPSGGLVTPVGRLEPGHPVMTHHADTPAVFIRPEDVVLDPQSDCRPLLVKSHFRGPGRRHIFELASGEQIVCTDHSRIPLEPGNRYGISINKRRNNHENNILCTV
ncbi:MAG: ABC transporter ATP-binding protein [Desulfotignum sp.]|nr:ABC transporter ATP-binding protein [Desulfotignum sp.]MCF8136108.1 ABC transporter ATP-binding protein [Desulfotignum sp.]